MSYHHCHGGEGDGQQLMTSQVCLLSVPAFFAPSYPGCYICTNIALDESPDIINVTVGDILGFVMLTFGNSGSGQGFTQSTYSDTLPVHTSALWPQLLSESKVIAKIVSLTTLFQSDTH